MTSPARALLAAALLLPFAGCVTVDDLRDRLRDRLAGETPVFGEELPLPQDSFGAEPNMAILPDGTIFITAVAGSQDSPNAHAGAAWLWRSTDQGATWETLRAPERGSPFGSPVGPVATRRPFGSSDADVAASPDGWIYYTDWWNWGAPVAGTPRAGNFLVERSADGGATWSATPITGRDTTGVDRQWLVAGDAGFLGLAYNAFNSPSNLLPVAPTPPGSELRMLVSRDHGASFSGPFVVAPEGPDVGYLIAKPFMRGNTTRVLFPYVETAYSGDLATPGNVVVARSEDGESWERTVVAENVTFETIWPLQGASDAAGNAYVAWNERRGDELHLMLSVSTDGGETWSAPAHIATGGLHVLPWVAATGEGRVAVGAYYATNVTGKPADVANETAWRMGVWESADAVAGAPFEQVLASAPVKLGPLCPEGAACAANRELLDYVAVAYSPDGRLHASWARSADNPVAGGAPIGLVWYGASVAPRV